MSASARRRLLDEARALGFTFVGYDGNEHLKFEHADTGERVTLPNSVPDGRVRFQNYRAALRRAAGVSTRGRPAVDGQRRRRKPRPVPDPRIAKAAADRAAILADKDRHAAQQRRLAELHEIEALMRR